MMWDFKNRAKAAYGFAALSCLVACSDKPEAPRAPRDAAAVAPAMPARKKGPPKRIFAKRFVVNVRSAPKGDAPRLGYLRSGAVLRATSDVPVEGEGCRRGFYELTTGGFVCEGKDVIAFDGDKLPEKPPAQPDFKAPLPYKYGHTKRDHTPMYRRLPTDQEAAMYEGYVIPGARPQPAQGTEEEAASEAPDSLRAVADAGVSPGQAIASRALGGAELVTTAPALLDAGPPTLDSLLGEKGTVLSRFLVKGFLVSLDREMEVRRRKYWRTMSNGFVPMGRIYPISGSHFRGVLLDGPEKTLPVGFLMSSDIVSFKPAGDDRVRRGAAPGYHFAFRIVDEKTIRGTPYVVTEDGLLFRSRDIKRVKPAEPPKDLAPNEKWVDVDLEHQTLAAFEGTKPVYATLISSGRVRDENNPLLNHATPTGSFRITSKYVTHTMDGDHAVDGPYSIEDVPYVMYFQLAYALHSAFWHDRFGRPKSHGCINMAPLDAKWLFGWSDPKLPEGWHAVFPTKPELATRIVIHGETPRR